MCHAARKGYAGFTVPGLLPSTTTIARGEPLTTFRNDRGQVTGYGQTQGNTTTYKNERGQEVGRAIRQQDGSILFYDSKGRSIGSARR